jgi:hypothetical protein
MSQRTIAVPAGALSYAHDHGFKLMSNGVEWAYDDGPMTLSVPRPRDHAGGKVTVRILFKTKSGPEGDHKFLVTAMTYNSGNELETYGGRSFPTMTLPGSVSSVYSTSLDILPGEGWGTGDWWYLCFHRQGMYRTNILMMSVGIDYNTTALLPAPLPRRLATTSRKAPAKAGKAPTKVRKPSKKPR